MVTLLLAACQQGGSIALPGDADAPEQVPEDTDPSWTPCADAPAVVINELLASNAQGIADEDGDPADWLELAFPDGLDLAGWSLSKDGTPDWTLTASPALIWASGKDRVDHAPFALDTDGGALFLHMPDGCVADHVEIPRLYADESWGRSADGPWEHFLEPTPGAPNTTESRPGFAEQPVLSPSPGFHAEVSVTVTPGTVRYTLDGAIPDEDDPLLTGAIAIEGTRVVRARAFEDGLWPSRIATATYWDDPSIGDAGIRILSLAVDPPDLWDDDRGIYAYGPDYEANYPYFGANFWELWERDLHVELWGPDGALLLSQDAGIQIAGGYSRAFDQRNFELLARTGYGPGTFAAELFHQETIPEYHRLYLRNGGDWCGTQIVDASVQALLRDDAGLRLPSVDAQAYEPALVYLNGEFWGLYELKERLDEWFVADHHDEDPDDLDRVKVGWTHEANWDLEQGDWEAFEALEALVTRDLADPTAWAEFEARVDLTNLASTVVAQGWIGNSDWWGNNLRLWRPHDDDGRWRWMVYDFGHGWPAVTTDHLGTSVATSARGLPIADALENDEFRTLLANVHADYLNTSMRGDVASARVQALADETEPVMSLQRARWCGGADLTAWRSAVDFAVAYASERAAVMDAQVITHLAPAGHAALSLVADPAGAGTFRLAAVEVMPPFAGSYYRDVPVTVTALPADGWEFTGWSDAALGAGATAILPMEGATVATARFDRLDNAEN